MLVTPYEKRAADLIKKYCVESPARLNLEEIANAEYLIVQDKELNNCLGKIHFNTEFGLITLNKNITDEGTRRFTLAHEMGHFFNEKFIIKNEELNRKNEKEGNRKNFNLNECSSGDILYFKSAMVKEREANGFAAELLMHKPWFGNFVKKRELDFELIKETAGHFNVSLTAAAIRYTEIGTYPAAVIMSTDGKVKWSAVSEYFPVKYIPKGYFVKKESAAFDFFNNKTVQTEADMIRAYTWFAEDYNCKEDLYLYEQNVVMKNYNSVLTLLWEVQL